MKPITQTLIAGCIAAAFPLTSMAAPVYFDAENAGAYNAGAVAPVAVVADIPTLQPATLRPARANSHTLVPGIEKTMVRKASMAAASGEFVANIPHVAPYVGK